MVREFVCFFINKDNNSETVAFIKNVYFVSEIMEIVSGDWVKKYGSIYRVWFGLRPVILLTAPELLEVCSVHKKLLTSLKFKL